jgi:DNA-binding HxlR family transcriptional regulator
MYAKLECPIMATMAMISDKWKVLIICKLKKGTLRFNELRRELKGVTQRVLTHQLRELEADGLVKRTIFAEVPPRVEYTLTDLGQTLIPVLDHLEVWAQEHAEELMAARAKVVAAANGCGDRETAKVPEVVGEAS